MKKKNGKKNEGTTVELIDIKEAIRLLKTARTTFYRWVRTGKIKGMKVGRQWRFKKEEIERFLKGEEPTIELRANPVPLVTALKARFREAGGIDEAEPESGAIPRAVSLIIRLGAQLRADTFHMGPLMRDDGSGYAGILRYRVDGVLHVAAEFDLKLLPAVILQLKTMASCDVHERARPQDGRIQLNVNGKGLDLRVSFVPALMGESVVARILSADAKLFSLNSLEYSDPDKKKLLKGLHSAWGMVLITGPMGSGKTTALYACLKQLANPKIKTVSVEDPVEYILPWVDQIMVRPDIGLTFAPVLRSILRSDPDVIMVGEIRDNETIMIAIQAVLTGHLVLTTLHTEDAPTALSRLVDIGAEPFLIVSTVKLVLAQRLIRKLCSKCSVKDMPSAATLATAEQLAREGGLDWESLPKKFRKPVGCNSCRKFGYKGRNVIAETLEMTPEIGKALKNGASADELRRIAINQGMVTMAADGIRKAAAGEITIEEVLMTLGLK